jgi:hypothetical protein
VTLSLLNPQPHILKLVLVTFFFACPRIPRSRLYHRKTGRRIPHASAQPSPRRDHARSGPRDRPRRKVCKVAQAHTVPPLPAPSLPTPGTASRPVGAQPPPLLLKRVPPRDPAGHPCRPWRRACSSCRRHQYPGQDALLAICGLHHLLGPRHGSGRGCGHGAHRHSNFCRSEACRQWCPRPAPRAVRDGRRYCRSGSPPCAHTGFWQDEHPFSHHPGSNPRASPYAHS